MIYAAKSRIELMSSVISLRVLVNILIFRGQRDGGVGRTIALGSILMRD